MQQILDKFLMFKNRLEKVFRHLCKTARNKNISCYRIYDHDLPEFPLLVELYGEQLYVAEYKRRHNLTDLEHEDWLEQCKKILSMVVGIREENIYFKLRKRKENRLDQYQKNDEIKRESIVEEGGLKFIINLSDYLDTGLFLDHRITRQMVRDSSKGRRVLNLFCYTCSFSVYAMAGGASIVHSVDLSNTYLKWAERNIALNFGEQANHVVVHADVLLYLKELKPGSFDLIILDPPTFSNSKRMNDFLDIQRDYATLINNCMRLLSPYGELFFSTNYSKFILNEKEIHASQIKDITKATTPFDFEKKLNRFCFRFHK